MLGKRRGFARSGTYFGDKLRHYLLPVSVIVCSLASGKAATNWLPSGLRSKSSWSTRKSFAISTNGDGQFSRQIFSDIFKRIRLGRTKWIDDGNMCWRIFRAYKYLRGYVNYRMSIIRRHAYRTF